MSFASRTRVRQLSLVMAAALASAAPVLAQGAAPTCSNALANLGFESGNLTGWTLADHPAPFVPFQNQPAGFSPGFNLFATAPTEGTRVVSHGFDGGTPAPGATIVFAQDLAVPKADLNLQFDYRAGWDMMSFTGSTLDRVFYVDIEPQGGGAQLQRTTLLTAVHGTQNFDTGSQRGTVPLANFAGQTIRVSFEWLIPEAFTGPGHFQLDNVMPLLPVSATVDGNGVVEPGEAAGFRPGWLNCSTLAVPTTGTATAFTGPAGGTYTIVDSSANYGSIAAGQSNTCTSAGGDCYSIQVTGNRPALHWDGVLTETLAKPGLKQWSVHVGGSFADVGTTSPFYRFVETLLHNQVTAGCTATTYCPANTTTRDQMSVFVLVAKEGAGYNPPACGTPMFPDVPASNPFCKFIEELARRGVVSGCGGGNYCPGSPVTREQMAVFVLRTLDPALNPPACAAPPFNDVPVTSGFCKWIAELVRRGIVSGCGGGNYCPGDSVTREQMGVFIAATFGLSLYGV
jgi:hypothetical protein